MTGFNQITNSDWFWKCPGLIWIEKCLQIRSEWISLVRIQIREIFRNFRIGSVSISIRMNPVNSKQSELSIRMNPVNSINSNLLIRSIRINPNDCEKFGFIRIDRIYRIQDCKCGLMRINSNWPDSIGLILKRSRIDSDWKISSD